MHAPSAAKVKCKSHFNILLGRVQDWCMIWGGSGTIYGWGHNHRGQLGGIEGAKIKNPMICDSIAALKPVQIVGGEQTLFCVATDGKVEISLFVVAFYVFFVNTRKSTFPAGIKKIILALYMVGSYKRERCDGHQFQ